jgi:hypothetical protein
LAEHFREVTYDNIFWNFGTFYLSKTLQYKVADFRHYTGKHNMLKMWVDEFIRQQQQQLSPLPQLSPPSQLSPLPLATTVNLKVLEDEIVPDPERSKASIPPLAAQEKSSPVILANISQAPPTAMVHTSSNAVSQLVAEMARNSSQKKIGNESETLTFSEMERRAILRQKESAALSARKMTAAPRNVVLPERQLLLSLTPIVPAGAASSGQFVNVVRNGSSDEGQHQSIAITPLSMSAAPPTVKAVSSSGQLLNGGDMLTSGGHLLSSSRLFNSGQLVSSSGQLLSAGPRALVSSLVDSAGRPTISGALQTVTVSTPSGQISLTKVIRSVSPR